VERASFADQIDSKAAPLEDTRNGLELVDTSG